MHTNYLTREQQRPSPVFTPTADILESQDRYVLSLELPGVDEKDIEVALENDVLTVRGHVESASEPNMRLVYKEYETGDFRRTFTLTDSVDQSKIEAELKDGVLRLSIPKSEPAQARKIAVKSA